jgi:hypothetical protein
MFKIRLIRITLRESDPYWYNLGFLWSKNLTYSVYLSTIIVKNCYCHMSFLKVRKWVLDQIRPKSPNATRFGSVSVSAILWKRIRISIRNTVTEDPYQYQQYCDRRSVSVSSILWWRIRISIHNTVTEDPYQYPQYCDWGSVWSIYSEVTPAWSSPHPSFPLVWPL